MGAAHPLSLARQFAKQGRRAEALTLLGILLESTGLMPRQTRPWVMYILR